MTLFSSTGFCAVSVMDEVEFAVGFRAVLAVDDVVFVGFRAVLAVDG